MKFTVKEIMTIINSLKYSRVFHTQDINDLDYIDNLILKFEKEIVGETKIKKVKVYKNGTK